MISFRLECFFIFAGNRRLSVRFSIFILVWNYVDNSFGIEVLKLMRGVVLCMTISTQGIRHVMLTRTFSKITNLYKSIRF
jgi:hypothetical protein